MSVRAFRKRLAESDGGFSVVEIAVAIVLLGLVLMAAAPAMLSSNQMTLLSSVASEANRTAFAAAEEAASVHARSCVPGTTSGAFTPSPGMGEVTFTRTTRVTCAGSGIGAGVGEVQVTITSSSGQQFANIVTRFKKEG